MKDEGRHKENEGHQTKRGAGSQRAEVALRTTAWPSSLPGAPRVYRCSLGRPDGLWERKSSSRSCRLEDGEGHVGKTHTQTATRQMVGLGFQATLFTTPPTGRVFMQRAVQTSQNRTVQSSEPAGRGQGEAGPGDRDAAPGAATARLSSTGLQVTSPSRRGEQPRGPVPARSLWGRAPGAARGTQPAIPQQLLRATPAPAPRRRDVTGDRCPENRPPPRSLQRRVPAPVPRLPAQLPCWQRARFGSRHGTARHGTALSSHEMPAGSSPGQAFPRAGTAGAGSRWRARTRARVSPRRSGLFLTPDLSHFPSPGPGIPRCATDRHRGHRELAAWKLQRYKKHMCLCGLLNCHLLSISSLRPAAQGSAFTPPASLSPLRSGRDAGSLGGVPRAAGKTHGAFWRQRAFPQEGVGGRRRGGTHTHTRRRDSQGCSQPPAKASPTAARCRRGLAGSSAPGSTREPRLSHGPGCPKPHTGVG